MGSSRVPARPSPEDATDPSIDLADLPLDDATAPGFRDDATSPSLLALPEEATAPVFQEEPTSPIGIREEPTAPAGTRTNRIVPPWLSAPDPPPREVRPPDPLFLPVAVFVVVLVISIGFVLFSSQPRRQAAPAAVFSTSP